MDNINIPQVDQLIRESTYTSDVVTTRPALLALTRATTQLIYQDLVATQYTNKSVAALYGLKYLNPLGKLSFVTGATFSGLVTDKDRAAIPELDSSNKDGFTKGQMFTYDDVVFKALVDSPFAGSTETDLFDLVSEANAASTIRMVSEAAPTGQYETSTDISEAKWEISKWQAPVRTRKFKSPYTIELLQDLEANGFNGAEMVNDLLATQMAEEINKDILQSLITVSKRFKVVGVSPKGVLDLTQGSLSSVEQARELYRYMCEMNASIQRNTSYSATYAVASSRVAAILASSGWLQKTDEQPDSAYGVLNNGIVLYCDNNSPMDYVVVGVKADYGENEMIGSLFYAPFAEGLPKEADPTDHIGAFKIVVDTQSMSQNAMMMVRYALCVNPYTMGLDDDKARVIVADDMDNFIGRSEMSSYLGVKLPKLEKA